MDCTPCHILLVFCGLVAGHVRIPPQFPNLLNVAELSAKAGYSVTNYEVITEDGYSLWLFRLGNNNGPPVLIQHGNGVACDSYIFRGNRKDLPYYLLDFGYDVWLANTRGTVYNEYSVKYNRTNPRFWDFTYTQYGYYDDTAFIDTVLKITNKAQLFYIGHSIGSTTFLIMCSTRPDYNAKIRAAILLAPVAFSIPIPERTPIIRTSFDTGGILVKVLRSKGINDAFPRTVESIDFLRTFCTGTNITRTICLDILGSLAGENRVNLVDFNSYIPYFGAGIPVNSFDHLIQLYETDSGEFRQYDYGTAGNLKRYGTTTPPQYNLKLVTAPIAIFWAYNDVLATRTSISRLASELPNLIAVKAVPDPKFTHLDMYVGDNSIRVLYPDVVDILDRFSKGKQKPLDKERINDEVEQLKLTKEERR